MNCGICVKVSSIPRARPEASDGLHSGRMRVELGGLDYLLPWSLVAAHGRGGIDRGT